MRKSDFEITHKIDTELRSVGLHHHEFYEVDFLISGKVTYTIESRIYPISPGDLLIISPKELHQVLIDPEVGPYERFTLWISPSLLKRLSTNQTSLDRCFDTMQPGYGNLISLHPAYRSTVNFLLQSLYQDTDANQFGSDILSNAILTHLMVLINRLATKGNQSNVDFSYTSPLISGVIEYINLHYAEDLSLQQLADTFYVSKYHLSHEFSHYVGVSIYQYLRKKRLLMSCQMLVQGKKSSETAIACGFSDYTCFYRAFCAEYGMSPREYARSQLNGWQNHLLF